MHAPCPNLNSTTPTSACCRQHIVLVPTPQAAAPASLVPCVGRQVQGTSAAAAWQSGSPHCLPPTHPTCPLCLQVLWWALPTGALGAAWGAMPHGGAIGCTRFGCGCYGGGEFGSNLNCLAPMHPCCTQFVLQPTLCVWGPASCCHQGLTQFSNQWVFSGCLN